MSRNPFGRYSFIIGTTLALLAGSTGAALAGADRLECKVESDSADLSMDARFEIKDGRAKLSTSFEATPFGALTLGDELTVKVAGYDIGTIVLETGANGDLKGDLNFDTTADENDKDRPFPPPNLPAGSLGAGTEVSIGPLSGCILAWR